ncbi:MAG: GerMN domain-containing protein [Patescibacteria group bacterium]|jgi:hypothetical protein
MKKTLIILVVIVIILILTVIGVRIFSGEDNWICVDGQWQKHGNPSAEKPTTGCGTENINEDLSDAEIKDVQLSDIISSPLEFTGQAKGSWFFESSFPVKIIDDKGQELGSGIATAQGDWMTEDFVPFTAKVDFKHGQATSGFVVLSKDNPSGLAVNDASMKIPVNFSNQEKIIVKVYFGNNQFDPQVLCNKVFAVNRQVVKTVATARVALDQLLSGPTTEEFNIGYFTSLNPGVKIQKLEIANGVASVDFDKSLEQGVGGSCRVAAIRAQITETLMQFPTIDKVVISINGRVEDILQP